MRVVQGVAAASVAAVAVAGAGALTAAAQPTAHQAAKPPAAITVVVANGAGPFGPQNRALVDGLRTAVGEINNKGGIGRRWRIRLLQGNLDGQSAASVRQTLRVRLGASVLILPCDSGAQSRIAAAAANAGVLILAPCNPTPASGKRWPSYWPVSPGANAEAAAIANLIIQRFNRPRVFIVSSQGSGYVVSLTNYFRRAAAIQHLPLSGGVTVPAGTKDFSGVVRLIAAAKGTNAVFTALYPPYVNRLALALRRAHLTMPIVGTTVLDNQSFLGTGTTSTDNALFASYGFVRVSAAARRFSADYRALTRKAPAGSFPGLGLETIRLLANVVTKVHSTRASAMITGLAHGIVLKGVGLSDRRYVAGGDHNPIADLGMAKVFQHEITPLLAITPTGVPTP